MFTAPAPPRCGEPGILLPSKRTKVLLEPRPLTLTVALDMALEPAVGPKEPKVLYVDILNASARISA